MTTAKQTGKCLPAVCIGESDKLNVISPRKKNGEQRMRKNWISATFCLENPGGLCCSILLILAGALQREKKTEENESSHYCIGIVSIRSANTWPEKRCESASILKRAYCFPSFLRMCSFLLTGYRVEMSSLAVDNQRRGPMVC